MNRSLAFREIFGGYTAAGCTLCLGVYLGTVAGDVTGSYLVKAFYGLALVMVLKSTFQWGMLRGFPATRESGHIAIENIVRNLVMAAIAWFVLILIFAPFIFAAFRLAR